MSDGIELPAGDIVLLIDDDQVFRNLARGKLERYFAELEAKADVKILSAASVSKFEAILGLISAEHREGAIIYALVDLMLPVDERRDGGLTQPEEANGTRILNRLQELKVPTRLVTKESAQMAGEATLGEQPYMPKADFRDEVKVKALAAEILATRQQAPDVSVNNCVELRSPIGERGQTRLLPLALKSSSMALLHDRIRKRVAREGAAVLLSGAPGVEFEQLAWLLFREITCGGNGPEYAYCPFNCESGGSLTSFLEEERTPRDGALRRYLFIENLHVVDTGELLRFCDALARSAAIRVDGDRVVLTVHKDKGDAIDRLFDLFCLAGFEDFILLEVPALSGNRRDDIAVYTDYYLQQRNRRGDSILQINQGALNLIKEIEHKRHFKGLAIFLDRLFRAVAGGVITTKVVELVESSSFVETAVRDVSNYIMHDDHEEPDAGGPWSPGRLHEMCAQFLLDPVRREPGDEVDQLYQDLSRIDVALMQASALDTDRRLPHKLQRDGADFWPWSRYPVPSRLLKQLERHELTVGLVPHSEAKR
jgi:hypothetical protein